MVKRSWIEVALPAEESRPYLLILEPEHRLLRAARKDCRRPGIGGVELRIEYLQADIEVRVRIELRPRADLVEAEVGIAAIARERDDAASEAASATADHRRIDQPRRRGIVVGLHVAAEEAGLPARVPDVLVERDHVPDARELDLGAGAKDAFHLEGPAGAGAGLEDRPKLAGSRAIAGGTFGVLRTDAKLVAARQVEQRTDVDRPALLVGRMAAGDVVDWAPIGTRQIMQGAGDRGIAPG